MTAHPFPPLTPPDETQAPGSRIWAEYHERRPLPSGWWILFAVLLGLCLWAVIVWAVYALFWSVTEWLPALIMAAGWSG